MHSIPSRAATALRDLFFLPFLCSISAALVTTGCTGESPTAQEAVTPDVEWQKLPTHTEAALRAVWGSSESDVFAVGDGGTILHYNGSRWSAMSSPTGENLHGVHGTGPDNVFAGGDNGTALHYDGVAWAALVPPTANNLGPVRAWSTYGTFADRDNPGVFRIYLGYSGGWSHDDTRTGASINDFRWIPEDFDRGVDEDMFIAGDDGAGYYYEVGWRPLEAGTADLVSVFGTAPGNVFVLDAQGTLWHFRGRTEGVPVAGTGQAMSAAVQRAYDDILLFGPAGRIYRYNRCELTQVHAGTRADFTAAWAAPDGSVFAVGSHGTILRFRGDGARSCPDNVTVKVSAGENPRISWSPPCAVSKIMVTAIEGPDQGNWFIAADGNHILPGLRAGDVPDCATEIRPRLGTMEAGLLYRITLVRRDIEGDLAVGFYNFRAGEQSQGAALAVGDPGTAPAAPEGVYVQPLRLIVAPEPGQPLILEFAKPERWRSLEFEEDGIDGPFDSVIRALVRDPDTGEVVSVQLDDIPVMEVGGSYAVYWPQPMQ
jgi:hypothetical protein